MDILNENLKTSLDILTNESYEEIKMKYMAFQDVLLFFKTTSNWIIEKHTVSLCNEDIISAYIEAFGQLFEFYYLSLATSMVNDIKPLSYYNTSVDEHKHGDEEPENIMLTSLINQLLDLDGFVIREFGKFSEDLVLNSLQIYEKLIIHMMDIHNLDKSYKNDLIEKSIQVFSNNIHIFAKIIVDKYYEEGDKTQNIINMCGYFDKLMRGVMALGSYEGNINVRNSSIKAVSDAILLFTKDTTPKNEDYRDAPEYEMDSDNLTMINLNIETYTKKYKHDHQLKVMRLFKTKDVDLIDFLINLPSNQTSKFINICCCICNYYSIILERRCLFPVFISRFIHLYENPLSHMNNIQKQGLNNLIKQYFVIILKSRMHKEFEALLEQIVQEISSNQSNIAGMKVDAFVEHSERDASGENSVKSKIENQKYISNLLLNMTQLVDVEFVSDIVINSFFFLSDKDFEFATDHFTNETQDEKHVIAKQDSQVETVEQKNPMVKKQKLSDKLDQNELEPVSYNEKDMVFLENYGVNYGELLEFIVDRLFQYYNDYFSPIGSTENNICVHNKIHDKFIWLNLVVKSIYLIDNYRNIELSSLTQKAIKFVENIDKYDENNIKGFVHLVSDKSNISLYWMIKEFLLNKLKESDGGYEADKRLLSLSNEFIDAFTKRFTEQIVYIHDKNVKVFSNRSYTTGVYNPKEVTKEIHSFNRGFIATVGRLKHVINTFFKLLIVFDGDYLRKRFQDEILSGIYDEVNYESDLRFNIRDMFVFSLIEMILFRTLLRPHLIPVLLIVISHENIFIREKSILYLSHRLECLFKLRNEEVIDTGDTNIMDADFNASSRVWNILKEFSLYKLYQIGKLEKVMDTDILEEEKSGDVSEKSLGGFSPDSNEIERHISLYLSLCKTEPEMLIRIFSILEGFDRDVQYIIESKLEVVILSIYSVKPEILCRDLFLTNQFTKLFSVSCFLQSFLLKLFIFISKSSQRTNVYEGEMNTIDITHLVETTKVLIKEYKFGPKLLLPIIHFLGKPDIIQFLPELFGIYEASDKQNKDIVKGIIKRLLSPLTKGFLKHHELFIQIHLLEKKLPIKKLLGIMDLLFEMIKEDEIYNVNQMSYCLVNLVNINPLPTIILRTILQIIQVFPSLKTFIINNVLVRLISRKIWKIDSLWEGFMKCCKILQPNSLQLILQLPLKQIESIVVKYPEFKMPIKDFINAQPPSLRTRYSNLFTLLAS